MKNLLVLGGGTAGTMVVNKLRNKLPKDLWEITVIDQDQEHIYQPGLLLMPFGTYEPEQLVKKRQSFFPKGVDFIQAEIEKVDPILNKVFLVDGREIGYDYLVIASGTTPRPDQTPGMNEPTLWYKSVFDFYTLAGSIALRDALKSFTGGRLVVHISEMPIKCPVAPLEFTFLADAYFEKRGIRDKVDIVYVTPLEGAFTKPVSSKYLGGMLEERKITLEPDFVIEHIDADTKTMVSMDEREIPFDLLVTIPVNMGADFIARSGLGDELNYVPTNKHNFLSDEFPNIFVLGDASNIPASKAGSVAHFAIDLFSENFVNYVNNRPMENSFDGHANCFIESGNRKGLLIDFNYEVEPLTGRFPIPVIGPLPLLKESYLNHIGKLAFRWIYWHILLKGRYLPIPALMSMAGKELVIKENKERENANN
ncbi:MAG: NAD(P)/FAD-dependent oxidoreductase [Actinobacteria bacterium]|jgi:sulfide:quinone oxidoreductase|nr:NAD(P)/FAD-dependent oxidoreductase [Actinomycetota bacterium]